MASHDGDPLNDLVFMGAAKAGKTTLVHRLLRIRTLNTAVGKYKPTIEDSYVRQFVVGDRYCQLRLVDTAGSYTFPAMERLWVKRASAFVLVCARDDLSSVTHLRNVLNRIREERKHEWKQLLLVIVVNKCDLHLDCWTVSDEEVEQLADEYEIPYSAIVFASALVQMGIDQMMRVLWRQNEESDVAHAIPFETCRKKPQEINRRSSAFAVLFGNSTWTRRDSSHSTNSGCTYPNESNGRVAVSGGRRFMSVSDGSPQWLVRTMGWMHIGSKSRTGSRRSSQDQYAPTVIDMNCHVS